MAVQEAARLIGLLARPAEKCRPVIVLSPTRKLMTRWPYGSRGARAPDGLPGARVCVLWPSSLAAPPLGWGTGGGGMADALCTAWVGPTELLSRLGEAAFDGLRRAHFAALREAIARTGGAEVKTTGDGLLATFPSAADAVSCAVAMQQAVDVHS